MAVSVLYIHHAGIYGGASRSLFELIGGFPRDEIRPYLITQRGEVGRIARKAGIDVIEAAGISQLDHTRFSHYRGRRWLLLLREIVWLPPTLFALIRARRRWPDIALVHVNELTLLPAIWMARCLFDCPLVIHVRSVQKAGDESLRNRLVRRTLRQAAAVIAIDDTVRSSLPPDVTAGVVHNGLTVTPAPRTPRDAAAPIRIGMVGNLLALKGVHEFIAAARLCKDRRLNVRFVLFGGNARQTGGFIRWLLRMAGFAQDVESELRHNIQMLDIGDIVEFHGFSTDLDAIYRAMDILCFPSQLDAPGRPVFEAAFWCVPGIVAVRQPRPDTLISGETGLAINEGTPAAIADAIEYFCRNPGDIARMGANAQRLAEQNFDSRRNASQVLETYRRILARNGGALS